MPRVKAISISDRKGVRKKNIDSVRLVENFGLENDAHGGVWHRQVSLLAEESIESMRQKGLQVVAGNFAENITTEGLDLCSLPVGSHLTIGDCELAISQLGKVCHNPCAIYHQAGDCVMPREGIFAVVLRGGTIAVGDPIETLDRTSTVVAVVFSKESEKEYGAQLKRQLEQSLSPGVLRFETLRPKEDNLTEVLDDLLATQKVGRLILFDPPGTHALAFAGRRQPTGTLVHYCRTLAEIAALTP